jgi:hypothetical protein
MLGRRPSRFPRPKLKAKRPKQRHPVTVCIAAITLGNHIVAVSDTMITGLSSSIDVSTTKMQSLSKDWEMMWSADDITQCIPVMELAAKYFQGRANTLQVARSCTKRAYQQHLSEIAADEVLGRYNSMSMEAFLKSKSKRFTESVTQTLMTQIQRVTADWQFLVFGFDSKKQPHLFTVEEPGKDAVYDSLGFCAIGSGRYAAEGLLFHLGQNSVQSLPKTLINLLCAKFMAEKAGAGRNTYTFVLRPGSSMFSMPTSLVPTIRQIWEARISPKVPDDLVNQITEAFNNGDIVLR